KGLVVPAARLLAESGNKLQGSTGITTERIENAHLYVGMAVQYGCIKIPAALVNIVDEQSDSNTTVRGFVQLIDKQAADDIVMDNVIPRVDTPFCDLRQ
ncbi:MAG: hypothetical protein JRD87_00005, partial [Deltaproteobacteria bacterium]|nr:hypothetical protein [Deltaproteobacteria bacterium]